MQKQKRRSRAEDRSLLLKQKPVDQRSESICAVSGRPLLLPPPPSLPQLLASGASATRPAHLDPRAGSMPLVLVLLLLLPLLAASLLGARRSGQPRLRLLAQSEAPDASFSRLLVSGFLSKAANFAQPFVFSKLYESDQTRWESIVGATDDVSFAKKRMVSPTNVYNGLVDMMEYAQVTSDAELERALAGRDAWLAFNVTADDVDFYAELAAKQGLKRIVLGVHVPPAARGADVVFEQAQRLLNEAGVAYTIVKFGDVKRMSEVPLSLRFDSFYHMYASRPSSPTVSCAAPFRCRKRLTTRASCRART